MKKSYLFIAFALVVSFVQAQNVNMGFIPSYHPGYSIFNIENAFQQSDGNIVSNVLVGTLNGNNPTVVGNIFYKASPDELQYTDSLFVADSLPPYYLFAKDPNGGNLRVNIEPDGNGGTALHISHFPDDDLNINPAEDLVVHLCDTIAFDYSNSYMIDSRNDLIIKYYTQSSDGSYTCHIARVGLDGTLKHTAVLPQNQNFLITMGEFDAQLRQYYQWTTNSERNLFLYVIDSSFQVKNSYIINKQLEETIYNNDTSYIQVLEEFWFGDSNMNSTFVIPDEGDLLVAAPYTWDSALIYNIKETGLAVARYDLRTMQRKALIHFNDQPGPITEARCMCFQKASDGNLYLVFREPMPNNNPTMSVVKLDRDLNLIWRRFCYEQSYKYDPYLGMFSGMMNDNEGNETGIYIVGYAANLLQAGAGIFHFFLTDDGLTAVHEGNIEIRPYAYYPNPAQDQLHLQYSPDVQPKTIELYDLQGRLVRTQSKGLESVNVQGLAPGQYLMKVTLEDGKSYTDKVVKE